jgi:hypothetical protein
MADSTITQTVQINPVQQPVSTQQQSDFNSLLNSLNNPGATSGMPPASAINITNLYNESPANPTSQPSAPAAVTPTPMQPAAPTSQFVPAIESAMAQAEQPAPLASDKYEAAAVPGTDLTPQPDLLQQAAAPVPTADDPQELILGIKAKLQSLIDSDSAEGRMEMHKVATYQKR